MKFFTSIFLLLGLAAQVITSSGLDETYIRNYIKTFYIGDDTKKDYLEDYASGNGDLFNNTTYQYEALEKTVEMLGGVADKTEKHVRNYYAAACIYFATNGVKNARTEELISEGYNPPTWINDDEWINNPDYCSWFGIFCSLDILNEAQRNFQSHEQEIIEIQLYSNSLYGNWPNEVGLLGDHLVTIDLYDNFYHSCYDYRWLEDMVAMEYLFFGSTAWDAYGIPNELSGVKLLRQFDCSYTYWSEGPIDKKSFKDLDFLEYVDMGDNIYNYDEAGAKATMKAFAKKPALIRLYFDNVRFVNSNRDDVKFSMDFLTEIENVIEAWFDFTKFNGGLPILPDSLRSFSVIYCGLTGTLEHLVDNTEARLDRVWLTGNKFTGTVPEKISEHPLTRLYLEFNDDLVYTNKLCEMRSTTLEYLGGNRTKCSDDCCTCTDFDCGNSPDPTPAPVEEPCVGFCICFSGSSLVEVENKGTVKMTDLALGDVVQVGQNKFEPIYSFGHKDSTGSAEFLSISTEGSSAPLEISPDHMVAIEGGRHVPASLVKKGDLLLTASDELAIVTSIKSVVKEGVFAPFTASGSIVVNGIVASNYIAYQGSEYLKVGEVETPFSYQWIAHTFNSVHRLAVMVGITGETYTEGGVSHWVDMPHKMFSWVVEQNIFVSASLIGLALPLFSFVWLIELLVSSPVSIFTAAALGVGGIRFLNALGHFDSLVDGKTIPLGRRNGKQAKYQN